MTKKWSVIDRGQFVPGRELDDQIAMNVTDAGLAVTIRPPFGARAKAVMARSISAGVADVDRTDLDPERRRNGLDGSELAGPER